MPFVFYVLMTPLYLAVGVATLMAMTEGGGLGWEDNALRNFRVIPNAENAAQVRRNALIFVWCVPLWPIAIVALFLGKAYATMKQIFKAFRYRGD